MSKLIYALALSVIIEIALVTFSGLGAETSVLYNFILNPIESGVFWVAVLALIGLAAAGIIASAFWNPNVWAAYAGFVVVIIYFSMNIVHLSTFIGNELESILSAPLIIVITMLITTALALTYIIAALEWMRGNQ